MDLSDIEYKELSVGRDQMGALVNQVVREAKKELAEWEEDLSTEGEEETDDEEEYSPEEEEEVSRERGKIIPIMTGKGGRC